MPFEEGASARAHRSDARGVWDGQTWRAVTTQDMGECLNTLCFETGSSCADTDSVLSHGHVILAHICAETHMANSIRLCL